MKDIPMDAECIALCDAMNRFEGIQTYESCCGHGKGNFCIWFSAESLEALPPLIYWFVRCHSGLGRWLVRVTTDCTMSVATFCAESTTIGDEAYAEAEAIAQSMAEQRQRFA